MPPVILDHDFKNADVGLKPPVRQTSLNGFSLQIANLDRSDPPDYKAGAYSRTPNFNRNVLSLTATPTMPKIDVALQVVGFDPSVDSIIWRLETLYVVGRYEKTNDSNANPTYASLVRSLGDVWTGEAHSAQFSLFRPDPNVTYDNSDDRVAGGQAILSVAAKPAGSSDWLVDYVHIRIVGANPSESDVRTFTAGLFARRDLNLLHAANAVFAWEAGFQQFDPAYRTHEKYEGVLFEWPHDPAVFPAVAFDFGIGISQFTHWGEETTPICWDWRENVLSGVNELLNDFASAYASGLKWTDWAKRSWGRYNGGDPGGTGPYAARLAGSPDGKLISVGAVPTGFDVAGQTAAFPMRLSPPAPRPWPVPALVKRSQSLRLTARGRG